MPPPHSPLPARPGASRFERLSRAYDDEIYPLFDRCFTDPLRAILAKAPLEGSMRALDVGAGAGHLADALAPAAAVAVEASGAMLALLSEAGRARLYEAIVRAAGEPALPARDATFDAVFCRGRADGSIDPWALLPELVRVCRGGGGISLCGPLRQTWAEPLDLLDEALERRGEAEARAALQAFRERIPTSHTLAPMLAAAGLERPRVTVEEKHVLFRSGREFFFSALVELGPLRLWKGLVGKGERLQAAFAAVKDAIDVYYAGRPFTVTVAVATVTATKLKT